MKFNIEIDCTPDEVRRLMGLPDMEPLHDHFQGRVKDLMEKGVTPDLVESVMKSWTPMGQNGFDLLRSVISPFADAAKRDTSDAKAKPSKS
jgi:hypothetical protein